MLHPLRTAARLVGTQKETGNLCNGRQNSPHAQNVVLEHNGLRGLRPADPLGEVARLQQMVVALQRQLQATWCSGGPTRGAPAVPEDHCSSRWQTVLKRSLPKQRAEFDQESSGIGASVHGHQHCTVTASISRYRLRGSRVGEASNPGGTPQDPGARLASLQLMFRLINPHLFVPTRAGTCCPESATAADRT